MSSPTHSPITYTYTDDDHSQSKLSSRHFDTPSPASASTSTPTPLSKPNALHARALLHGGDDGISKRKSAFLPYRPHATVLTNLQRGNTEATFCPVEVALSFHERAGQGELTQEMVRLEVAKQREVGRNIDFRDSHDYTALHWACYYGQVATVQLLLEAGASVDAKAPELVTPLLLAAAGGHHEVVRLLLDSNANYQHMDIVGNTALMYAAAGNHPHTCNELLARDPDMTATNENGDTAYSLAVESGAALAQAVLDQYLGALLSL